MQSLHLYQHLLAPGIRAAKANALPALILWLVGSFIVISFYLWPAALPVFVRITESRASMGVFYAMLSTTLFAGIIPFLMQALQRDDAQRNWTLQYLLYLLILWPLKGLEIEYLYRLQAFLFGHGNDSATLLKKVLFDQLVYAPVWGVPTLVMAMLFARYDYSVARLRADLASSWYQRRILPIMLPNWFVWVPSTTLIYLLPTPLQLPMQNIVTCIWVLMVMFMTAQQSRE